MAGHPLTGPTGLKRLFDPKTKRLLTLTHYTVLGDKEVQHRREERSLKHEGGYGGALWQADHELNLRARPGELIFPSYGDHISKRVVPHRNAVHILAADFGHTHATSIHFAQVLPHQVQVYYEHYLSGHDEATHKARIVTALSRLFPVFDEQLVLYGDDFFRLWKAVGDKHGPGYMSNYRRPPYPIRMRSPLAHISGTDEESKKLKRMEDEVEAGEAYLDGLFRPRKRCCFRTFAVEEESCTVCKRKLEVHVGMVIDPSCKNAHLEIPLQVIDEGVRSKKVANDAVDSLRYLALYAMSLRGRKPPKRDAEGRRPRVWRPDAPLDIELEEAYGAAPALMRIFK